MIVLVVDASVLVGELLRERGPPLFRHPDLRIFVAEQQLEETHHELDRRLSVLESRGLSKDRKRELEDDIQALFDEKAIGPVAREHYEYLQEMAVRRVPRDERDWPTVAASIALDAAILTADNDFLGCGRATWTVETLTAELERS
jgi:predicted nucleic acid-binding protein